MRVLLLLFGKLFIVIIHCRVCLILIGVEVDGVGWDGRRLSHPLRRGYKCHEGAGSTPPQGGAAPCRQRRHAQGLETPSGDLTCDN